MPFDLVDFDEEEGILKGNLMQKSRVALVSIVAILIALGLGSVFTTFAKSPRFRVLVLAENDQYHTPMAIAGRAWIEKMGADSSFAVDTIANLDSISTSFLAKYQVFVQLNWWAFRWTKDKETAFEAYINSNRGWIGIHAACLCHATLEAGEDNWTWYRTLIGGINFVQHPAFQNATVIVEDRTHPVTRGLPATFSRSDEWYEFDKDPRPNVHVLMRVDETSYTPITRAPGGDHPEIWTNENYHRVLVCAMGHSPDEFTDPNFQTFLRNAIMWTAEPMPSAVRTPGISYRVPEKSSRVVIGKQGRGISVHVAGVLPAGIRLTDAKGRVILAAQSSTGDFHFDRAGLKNGIYVVTATCASGEFSAILCLN